MVNQSANDYRPKKTTRRQYFHAAKEHESRPFSTRKAVVHPNSAQNKPLISLTFSLHNASGLFKV
jgi:hypothetical protein